jgi:diguanylate cyclase (GGDEF)-like protein/PAS domain S-box-containing protein
MIEQSPRLDEESDVVMTNAVLHQLTDGVYIVDRDRRIVFWNHAAEKITGFAASDVTGSCCWDDILRHVDHDGRCLCEEGCPLAAIIEDGQPREAHVYLSHHNGHRVPVHVRATPIFGSDGDVIACVEVFNDDTQRLSMMDRLAKLESQAMLDSLTGLANRRHFEQAIETSLSKFQRDNESFGLIMADIDHFKRFNDYYGHDVGDKIIKLVARTLIGHCRTFDTACRWGGEEFALIVDQIDSDKLNQLAHRIRNTVGRSALEHNQCHIAVTLSIGATVVKADDNAKSLFKRADQLLFESKQTGRNRVTMG